MQYLESDSSNLETYSVTNRKPVEISKNRRNVEKARFLGNDPSKCVLNKLQASQIRNRCASTKIVTVIEPRAHYRRSNCLASLSGEGRSNVTECVNVKVRCLACFGDLFVKRHLRVKMNTQIFDWWLELDEPATEMDLVNSAKASTGSDLGLKKAMASDLDGLRWRPLFRSQLWTLWVQDSIEATWCTSVEAFVPIYSWVSSAYWWKEHQVAGFWQVRIYYFGNRWYEKNKKKWPRTEPWVTPVDIVVEGEDDKSILTKDERSVR